MILDCQAIKFSNNSSTKRINLANVILGADVVNRLLSFSLYLMGASIESIATSTNKPYDTVKSSIKRMMKNGLTALNDRRTKDSSTAITSKIKTKENCNITIDDNENITVNISEQQISISTKNSLQLKVFLLTLLHSDIISSKEVSKALNYSTSHIKLISKKLHNNDVYDLIDKRKGQEEFRFTSEIKSELILQFILDHANEGKTSSILLSDHLKKRINLELSPRSIRFHLERLGLGKIQKEISNCLETAKKKLSKVLNSKANLNILKGINKPTQSIPKPRILCRLQIKALLEAGYSEIHIASLLRCNTKTVRNWIKRFQTEKSILDKNRSGRPPKITLEAKFRLIGFYCQVKPLPGCSRWSIRWAESYLKKKPSILKIPMSRSSIHRCLAFHSLKPHKMKYFLHISDPYFFEKMEKIISIYLNPPKYLYCFDECTGLQALERVAPKLSTENSHTSLVEFKYERHGTVSIFSVLNVSDGKIFTDIIADHTSPTIIKSLKQHISQHSPTDSIHYICDNYSSHSTEELCQEIAKLCKMKYPTNLDSVPKRKEWLESDDKRIMFHFLPCHGSWLNQIEIWFGILQQKGMKGESFSSATDLEEAILNFTDTWNKYFSHPFEWDYTGEGLYEKVVLRLTRWLQFESQELSYTFFEKQLKLMENLVLSYWKKVKKEVWVNLHKILKEKNTFIEGIISNINCETFKNLKGRKNDTVDQRKYKIVKKVEGIKYDLTLLLSEFKYQLSTKLK